MPTILISETDPISVAAALEDAQTAFVTASGLRNAAGTNLTQSTTSFTYQYLTNVSGSFTTVNGTGTDLTFSPEGLLTGGVLNEVRQIDTIIGPTGTFLAEEQRIDVQDLTLPATSLNSNTFDELVLAENPLVLDSDEITPNVPVFGTEGADVLFGNPFPNTLIGLGGDDVIISFETKDVLIGGDGNDSMDGGAGNDQLFGENGNDSLFGAAGDDVVFGGAGNDFIIGDDGNDGLFGEAGNDVIFGGNGNDYIEGGSGFNEINGENGEDQILGGADTDIILGGFGNDLIDGGAGNDVILGESNDDTIDGNLGDDTIDGGFGADILNGGEGNDLIFGAQGNDTLNGDAGNDTLFGGDGDDRINGGAGTDLLSGEAGADTFTFGSNDGFDFISDFENGVDSLTFFGDANSNGQVQVFATLDGSGTWIGFDNTQVILEGVDATLIDPNDFAVALPGIAQATAEEIEVATEADIAAA